MSNIVAHPIEKLLSRLDGVRDRGNGQYLARCPAHDDKNPSLSIRETNDGTLLLKCWSGCSAAEITHSVGLELRDLFPDNGNYHQTSKRPQWNPRDLLAILNREATVLMIIASDLSREQGVDLDRLKLAYQRINKVVEESNVLTR